MRLRSGFRAYAGLGRAALALLVATACGASDTAPPDNTMRLSFDGTVKNANTLAPIANATVIIGTYTVATGSTDPAFYTPRVSTTTDAQGKFTVEEPCMTKDYLEVRATGYQTVILAVACAPVRRAMLVTLIPNP